MSDQKQDWRYTEPVTKGQSEGGGRRPNPTPETGASDAWHIQEYVSGWLVGQEQPRVGLGPPPAHGPWWFRQEGDARRLADYLNSLEAKLREAEADAERLLCEAWEEVMRPANANAYLKDMWSVALLKAFKRRLKAHNARKEAGE